MSELTRLFCNSIVLHGFPRNLKRENSVEIGSGLTPIVVTVNHREARLNIRSKVICISCVPECACMTVECVSMAPCRRVCWQDLPVIWQQEKGENKLPPILG